jgi:hypothetical protein
VPGDNVGLTYRRAIAVNNDDLMVERGAEFRVDLAVHADVRPNPVAALDLRPPGAKHRPVQCHAPSDDGHQPPARPESQQSLLDVPPSELRAVPPYPPARRRERRVHDDRVIKLVRRQQIVEALGVERGRRESL